MNIGEIIDRLFEIRQQKSDINEALKELTTEESTLQWELIPKLREQGVNSSQSGKASATISDEVFPSVVDWDAYGDYIIKEHALYLLERRVAVKPFRELVQARSIPPGIEPIIKTSLSIRKLRSSKST